MYMEYIFNLVIGFIGNIFLISLNNYFLRLLKPYKNIVVKLLN